MSDKRQKVKSDDKRRTWSPEELRILELYKDNHPRTFLHLLPGKTESSIASKLVRMGYRENFQGISPYKPPKRQKWPGMEKSRHAYNMTEEEWNQDPMDWHRECCLTYFGEYYA